MVKSKKEYEEVNAYPNISMLNNIEIHGKNTTMRIGGWDSCGFYLEEPYILKEGKSKDLSGKNNTYYKIVKDKTLQSKREKEVRELNEKRKKEDIKYFKDSIKDAKEKIENYTEKLKELKEIEQKDE